MIRFWTQATKAIDAGAEGCLAGGHTRVSMEGWNRDGALLVSRVGCPNEFDLVIRSLASGSDEYYAFFCSDRRGSVTRFGDPDGLIDPGPAGWYALGRQVDDDLLLVVPRFVLDPLLPPAARQNLSALCLEAGSPLCGVLMSHLRQARICMDRDDVIDLTFVFTATMNLLAGAVASNGTAAGCAAAQRSASEALEQIKVFVAQNLSDPDLGVEMILHDFRLSRTALYEMFRPLSGVASYIQTQRLHRCLLDVVDAQQRHRRISDVAYSWGFNSASHFSRNFRQAFGFSPSDARNAASAGDSGGGAADAVDAVRLDEWVRWLSRASHG